MYLLRNRNYNNSWPTFVFAPLLLFLFGILVQNAFADQVIATIPVGTTPVGVGVNPITNEIYIANEGGTVSVVNGSTNSITSTISVENHARSIAVNPITNMVYVVEGKEDLAIINGSTNTLVQTIYLSCQCDSGGFGERVAVDPATNMIYATAHDTERFGTIYDGTGNVIAINGTTNTIAGRVEVKGWTTGVTVNQDTNMIYSTAYNPNTHNTFVIAIDGSTNSIVANTTVPNNPAFVATNPITNMIYASESTGGKLVVIDGSTNTIIDQISTGTSPDGVAVNPNTNMIYVVNQADNTTSVVDGSSNQVVDTIQVGSNPYHVDVNPNTNTIYVANEGDNTVSVIQGTTPPPQATSQLQVNSQDSFGNTITGLHTELYAQNGTQIDAGFTPYNFTLNNGQSYTVSVDNYGKYKFNHWLDTGDTNSNRTISITSNESITAVYATVPTHPSNLTATAASSSEIDLSWNAPSSDGGSPITGYKIQISTDGSTWTTIVKNTGSTDTSYSDIGLNHTTTYYYRVFALNSAGSSYRSNIASATTLATVPSAPTGLAATANLLQIDLSWSTPADNGGSAIMGYMIERSTDGGTTWNTIVSNTGSTGTTYSDTNVLPLTTYTYRVSAINDIGTGEPSNTASASTPSIGLVTPPSLP